MARNTSNRGFASMDPERQRRISSMGGRSSQSGSSREDYRDYDSEDDYDDYDDEYDPQSNYDNDYDDDFEDRGYRSRSNDSDYDEDDNNSSRHWGSRRNGNRGFASMPREEVRRIASMGGRAAHEYGNAHEWDSDEAREAGHRGGMASHSGNREYLRGRDSYDDDYRRGPRSNRNDYDFDYDSDYRRSSDGDRSSSYGSGRSSRRGFASMPREEVRRIARRGGQSSHDGNRSNGNNGNSRSRNYR
jgi:general stress protein YciG